MAVGILAVITVFIFRAFSSALAAAKLSQNISLACILTENKIWEINQQLMQSGKMTAGEGQQELQGREFRWRYAIEPVLYLSTILPELQWSLQWDENARRQENLAISSYLGLCD